MDNKIEKTATFAAKGSPTMPEPSLPDTARPPVPGGPKKKQKSSVREYAEALLTAGLIAFFLRGFLFEAFKIPSPSMVPTLMVGDHLFVNKFIYGIRIPFTTKWITHFKTPERGEVIVFIYPNPEHDPHKENMDYIKRVVGVPGDEIRISGDDVYINGQKTEVEPVTVGGINPKNNRELLIQPPASFPDAKDFKTMAYQTDWESYTFFLERMGNHTHIKREGDRVFNDGEVYKVPPGHLFVMGDNRDNSADSRVWGYVPIENLKGRAMFIWLSWDHDRGGVRWDRFFNAIK